MTDKSPDAFRTISEVGADLDLPQHVLRFWETRFTQIRPLKRSGGRRYYRPEDVDLLKAIRHLLYGQGFTIKGVQRILKEQGVKAVITQALKSGGAAFQPEFNGVAAESDDKIEPDEIAVVHLAAEIRPKATRLRVDETEFPGVERSLLSFEDAHRLKAALFELNEGLRILHDVLNAENS